MNELSLKKNAYKNCNLQNHSAVHFPESGKNTKVLGIMNLILYQSSVPGNWTADLKNDFKVWHQTEFSSRNW